MTTALTDVESVPWQCLFQPAVVPVGSLAIAAPLHAAMQRLRREVASILQAETKAPVQIAAVLVGPRTASWVWGINLRLETGGTVRIALDQDAARVLVDAVARCAGGHLAPGRLTELEFGILDYLLLRCLDRQDLADCTSPAEVLAQAVDPASLALVAAETVVVHHQIRVGHRSGCMRVEFPAAAELRLPPASPSVDPGHGRLQVSVTFPELGIPAVELRSASPGDVLLLPPGTYPQPGGRAWLTSATGWRVAAVVVASDTPRLIAVEAGSLVPSVPLRSVNGDLVSANIVVGEAQLEAQMLAGWEPGTCLELDKSQGVVLVAGAQRILGELVRAEAEVGLRILRLEQP